MEYIVQPEEDFVLEPKMACPLNPEDLEGCAACQ